MHIILLSLKKYDSNISKSVNRFAMKVLHPKSRAIYTRKKETQKTKLSISICWEFCLLSLFLPSVIQTFIFVTSRAAMLWKWGQDPFLNWWLIKVVVWMMEAVVFYSRKYGKIEKTQSFYSCLNSIHEIFLFGKRYSPLYYKSWSYMP